MYVDVLIILPVQDKTSELVHVTHIHSPNIQVSDTCKIPTRNNTFSIFDLMSSTNSKIQSWIANKNAYVYIPFNTIPFRVFTIDNFKRIIYSVQTSLNVTLFSNPVKNYQFCRSFVFHKRIDCFVKQQTHKAVLLKLSVWVGRLLIATFFSLFYHVLSSLRNN